MIRRLKVTVLWILGVNSSQNIARNSDQVLNWIKLTYSLMILTYCMHTTRVFHLKGFEVKRITQKVLQNKRIRTWKYYSERIRQCSAWCFHLLNLTCTEHVCAHSIERASLVTAVGSAHFGGSHRRTLLRRSYHRNHVVRYLQTP